MKIVIILTICFLFSSCSTDYGRVEQETLHGNTHAKDLLLSGFNRKSSENISTILIDRALHGDEEAKAIVIAQSQSLCGMPQTKHTVMPVPIVMPRSR